MPICNADSFLQTRGHTLDPGRLQKSRAKLTHWELRMLHRHKWNTSYLGKQKGGPILSFKQEDRLRGRVRSKLKWISTKNGKEFLLTDTVGFIQKLPTTVVKCAQFIHEAATVQFNFSASYCSFSTVLQEKCFDECQSNVSQADYFAAFRATLEEISESSSLVHVVDKFSDPERMKLEAEKRDDVICISALSGEGITEFCSSGEIEAFIPFEKGELLSTIQRNASNSNIPFFITEIEIAFRGKTSSYD
ncbi:unnamed protein product [Malus baccata var. baccata]